MERRWLSSGLLAMTLASVLLRGWATAPAPHPPGTDGYYYVVQAEYLASEGHLHVPDASWVLGWLSLPHLLGAEAVAGTRLAAVLLAAAAVPAAWWLGRTVSREASWTAAAAALASPTLTHLCADFPKSLAVIPALWLTAAAASRAAQTRSAGWGAAALLLALGTATAHRVGAAALGLAALGGALGLAAGHLRLPRWAWLGLLGVGLLFGALAAFLPGLLHPSDLERVTSQLRASPWPPPPWSWLPLRHTHPLQVAELSLLPWAALLGGALSLRRRPALLAWLLPLAVAMLPWWRADSLDLGYRLGLLAPFLALPVLLQLLPAPALRYGPALALLAPASLVGFDPRSTPPYEDYDRWLAPLPRPLPDLLIVEPGASFYVTHVLGIESMAWDPEPELDPTRIGRVVWGIRDGEWAAYAPSPPPAPLVRLDRDHVYAREDVWDTFVLRALAADDDDLTARLQDPRNPSLRRPASLLRNRPPPQLKGPGRR
jgi:hypothetical protein